MQESLEKLLRRDPPTPSLIIALLLVLATILALWPVCTGEFLSWDDNQFINGNRTLLPPTWHSVTIWWTHPDKGLWIPITYTAWGLLARVAQLPGEPRPTLDPFVFHTANLLLHLLTALVVFRLIEWLLAPRRPVPGKVRWAAAAGAALFALHPVQVEPVAWAMGLRDILGGLLTLLAIGQYLHAAEPEKIRAGVYDSGLRSPRPRNRSRWLYATATLTYVLALLTKPTAIVAPLIAAVLQRAMAARRANGPTANAHSAWRLGLWLVMAIPVILVTHHLQPITRASEYVQIWQRPMVALDAIAFYVWKTIWPVHLCTDYGRVPWKIFESGQAYWTWTIPAAIAGGLIVVWRRRAKRMSPPLVLRGRAREGGASGATGAEPASSKERTPTPTLPRSTRGGGEAARGPVTFDPSGPMVLAGAAVFLLGLLPVLGLVGFEFQGISTVADRYLYLPMFGVALMAAAILASPSVSRRRGWAVVGAVGGVLGLLAFRSFTLTWTWHDSQSLFAHTLAVNPLSTAANDSLCLAALNAGDFPEAIDYANQSIAGNPRRPHGYVNLANVYAHEGQTKQAVVEMMKAYRLEPRDPQVLVDLGVQLANDGQLAAAVDRFTEALKIEPNASSAEVNLAIVLDRMGRRSEGFAHLERAVELEPDSAPVQVALGDFLHEMGKPAEARAAYEKALRLQPGYQPAINGLLVLKAVF